MFVKTLFGEGYSESANPQKWCRPDSANPQRGGVEISPAKIEMPPSPSNVF